VPEPHRNRLAWRWAAFGLALSPGAPAGLWLVLRTWVPEATTAFTLPALLYSGLATATVFAGFGWVAGRLMDRLHEAALRDGLTGLFNRRFLRESLPRIQAAAARDGEPLCVLMIDLDHFKAVNDRHGHLIGDQTLRAVADTLRSNSRESDLIARYGGEEFAVLCPRTTCEIGVQVAERLREAVAALDEPALGHPGPQTISLGVAVQSPQRSQSPEALLEQADLALYEAKHRGRNRITARLDGCQLPPPA